MADTQSTSSDQQDPFAGLDPEIKAALLQALGAGQQQQGSASNPIGVPYYQIDPRTGQPQLRDPGTGRFVTVVSGKYVYADTGDPYNGAQPELVRWSATVPTTNTEDNLARRNERPGTSQIVTQGSQQIAPRYFDGSQFLPGSLSPTEVAALQRAMIDAGLMKNGAAQLGIWDTASVQAYTELLSYANSSGIDAKTALARWGDAHKQDPNAGKAPLTIQVTSLDDLRPVIRKAFIDTLGTGISTDQVDALAAQYQQMQAGAQQQSYNASDTGGTVTQAPSVDAFAQAEATKRDPLGAQEHTALGFIDQFRSMLGGWQ